MIRLNVHGFGRIQILALVRLLVIWLVATDGVTARAQTSGTWTKTGKMPTPGMFQTAILLQNGQVLISGGQDSTKNLTGSALYDPAHGSWAVTGSMNFLRFGHTTTVLQNGQVLVAGGTDSSRVPLSSAELYDPVTGQWTFTGSMSTARTSHTATLLPNGRVLVAGGNGQCVPFSCPAFASGRVEAWRRVP